MANLEDLITYLSQGTCIACVGSGPSIGMGLPSWKTLANGLLEQCRRAQKPSFGRIEDYYRLGKYPQMLGEVARSYGEEYVVKYCKRRLEDPGGEGAMYKALARLPFASYFTTNVEKILFRHVEAERAFRLYGNSQEDLETVEVDVLPCVVQLHGTLDNPDSLVLTDTAYRLWYHHGAKEYYQSFLRVHLGRDRFLFVGYSMNDPEILDLRKRLETNLRRHVPAYAILANVGEAEVAQWSREYNIEVVPYSAPDGDHSELLELLNAAVRFVATGEAPRKPRGPADMRTLQKLYLWHRFEVQGDTGAQIDAMKSVVLMCASGLSEEAFTVRDLTQVVGDIVGLAPKALNDCVAQAMKALKRDGWVGKANPGRFTLDDKTRRTIEAHGRQFEDLVDTFKKQVVIDLRARESGLSTKALEDASDVVLDAVVDVFESRGVELVRQVFGNEPVAMSGAIDVFRQISACANAFADTRFRFLFVSYVVDLLTKPTGITEHLLDYLSKAFFSLQALRMDPTGHKLFDDFLTRQALLVDENVLIPLLAKHEPRHQLCQNAVDAGVERGLCLYTTDHFVDQILEHAKWASIVVIQYGEQSLEVYNAAAGKAGYRQNAFLSGFVQGHQERRPNLEFGSYLNDCFGGPLTRAQVWDALRAKGVGRIDVVPVRYGDNRVAEMWSEIRGFIEQAAFERHDDKSSDRMEREADAYVIMSQWVTMRDESACSQRDRCGFLTYATALAHVARNSPYPVHHSVLVSPSALYELLIRYAQDRARQTDFRTLMLSSYFRPAGQFIDKQRYAHFFGPLLRQYGETFDQHFELYRTFIDRSLSAGVLNEYEPLDRPAVVASLERALEAKSALGGEVNELVEKNLRLEKRVRELEERERKRRQYVRQQRERAQQRRRQ